MKDTPFQSKISHHIWDTKYRYHHKGEIIDESIEDTWQRVAQAVASVEEDSNMWEQEFYKVLEGFTFIPAGRILAGAGTEHKVILFNCFVMGIIEDSIPSLFENLKQGALTMQQGGSIGYDFSTIRPQGSLARSSNISSGPVSFMNIWDTMCGTMLSTGARRSAMMATLRCDHPDIMTFINAKQQPGTLTNFNLSVLVSDAFMEAVHENDEWPLVFPDKTLKNNNKADQPIFKRWNGTDVKVPCRVFKTVRAQKLWNTIMQAAYDTAEPGVLFIDRINSLNNLNYCEYITATNPCGEVPLPPYGTCNLGSINLTHFVKQPFSADSNIDLKDNRKSKQTAVRMLDNVFSLSRIPLKQQKEQALQSRRIGLGITGLADALIMLGHHYGSKEARSVAEEIINEICQTAYVTSTQLAKQKETWPLYVKDRYLKSPFIQKLPKEIQNEIFKNGI